MYQILYIDDEPDILELVRLYLESFGTLLVETCSCAEEAEILLSQKGYDTIVIDYCMPDTSGIDLLKSIRAKGNKCPIIIYTGRGREDVVIDALNNGADFYLQKFGEPTFEFAELHSKIQEAIRKYHAETNMKEASALLRSILDSTADGILVVNTAGKITAYNRKFIQMWKIPLNYIENGDYSVVLSYILHQIRDTDLFLNNENIKKAKNCKTGIDLIYLKDDRIYERNSLPQMVDGVFIGKVWSFRDITEKVRSEMALNDAINQIQKNLAELAVLNDEIRNPLTVIAGLAQLQMADQTSDIMVQVRAIDEMIDHLDSRWYESTKILNYLRRHHGVKIITEDKKTK